MTGVRWGLRLCLEGQFSYEDVETLLALLSMDPYEEFDDPQGQILGDRDQITSTGKVMISLSRDEFGGPLEVSVDSVDAGVDVVNRIGEEIQARLIAANVAIAEVIPWSRG